MNIDRNKNFIVIALVFFSVFSVFISFRYFNTKAELKEVNEELSIKNINIKILDFNKLFIDNVLQNDNEVDFETRLNLENAVRDLKDNEILMQWNKFINSKTENQAQEEVKNLLEILINKIKS